MFFFISLDSMGNTLEITTDYIGHGLRLIEDYPWYSPRGEGRYTGRKQSDVIGLIYNCNVRPNLIFIKLRITASDTNRSTILGNYTLTISLALRLFILYPVKPPAFLRRLIALLAADPALWEPCTNNANGLSPKQ
jgi:hypothetical protein